MNVFAICKLVVITLLLAFSPVSSVFALPASQQAQLAYAKWGRMAIVETKKKYPGAAIVDYLHVGRQQKSPTNSEETFKLWLRKDNREWGVYVRILFETSTERVTSVSFEETTR